MRWWTSDLHFGHRNIIDYVPRPFREVSHMNEMLVKYWNESVDPNDSVYIVGDFAMGQIAETLLIAERLNGTKVLMAGNHDRCWMGAQGSAEKRADWQEEYEKVGLMVVQGPQEIELSDGTDVLVNHFPYVEISRHGDRYSAYRSNFEGKWLIHGHTHQKVQCKPENFEIHVGTDAWDYHPVSEDQIIDIIQAHGGTP